jgi:hypothetical protein
MSGGVGVGLPHDNPFIRFVVWLEENRPVKVRKYHEANAEDMVGEDRNWQLVFATDELDAYKISLEQGSKTDVE